MEEKKKRMNPWVPAVIMGVVAILFSFYALQSQSDLQDARVEIERLNTQVIECKKSAEEQQKNAAAAMGMAAREAEMARQAVEGLLEIKQKKMKTEK